MYRKYIAITLTVLLSFSSFLEAQIVRRAVFDFGSGSIRIHVADVDTQNTQAVHTLYTDSVRVFLSEDLAKQNNKKFSEEIQKVAIDTAKMFKEKALDLNTTQFYGIATEAYRSALNGEELVRRYHAELSIPVNIVSKEEEGKFSFLTLAMQSKVDPNQMICWDIGGGSIQVTYLNQEGELRIYHAPYGRLSTKNALLTHVKNNDHKKEASFLNPVSLTEWKSYLEFMYSALPSAPQDLLDKIKDPNVQIIGVAGHPPELAHLGMYQIKHLIEVRDRYLNKSDEEITQDLPFFSAPHAVSDLILVHAIMEKLGIDKISYFNTRGSSNSMALLTSEDLWRDK